MRGRPRSRAFLQSGHRLLRDSLDFGCVLVAPNCLSGWGPMLVLGEAAFTPHTHSEQKRGRGVTPGESRGPPEGADLQPSACVKR